MSLEEVREILLALPGVEEGPCYGTPGFRIRGKLLARLREDGESLVVKVPFEEREFLMQSAPETFYITEHYRNYPAVLARLSRVDRAVLSGLLEDAWRAAAPKRMVAAHESGSPAG